MAYYSEIDPTGIGMPIRDVIDVVERYPDRFIPGTTMDPRDPHAHERLKAAVNTYSVRIFGDLKLRMRYDDPDAIRLFHYCGDLGLPVLVHLQPTFPRLGVPTSRQWWYGGGLENMEAPCDFARKLSSWVMQEVSGVKSQAMLTKSRWTTLWVSPSSAVDASWNISTSIRT